MSAFNVLLISRQISIVAEKSDRTIRVSAFILSKMLLKYDSEIDNRHQTQSKSVSYFQGRCRYFNSILAHEIKTFSCEFNKSSEFLGLNKQIQRLFVFHNKQERLKIWYIRTSKQY